MAYVAPIHRASSVRHAIKLQFLRPEEDCLVVAKANRLEIYVQTTATDDNDDGSGLFTLQHSKAISGKITMLSRIRPVSSPTDHLFVGTDRYSYFTVSWDPDTKQLKTERSYVDLAERASHDAQDGHRVLIDPTGRFMTLEIYEGSVTVIPIVQPLPPRRGKQPVRTLEVGSLGEPASTRIDELFVRSSAFLWQEDGLDRRANPRMAFLFEDTQRRVKLQIRTLEYTPGTSAGESGTPELKESHKMLQDLELGASHLIPVPGPAGGVLILGETSIKYLDLKRNDVKSEQLDEATVFVAWEKVDNQRWLLADDYGRLYFLMLLFDDQNVVETWKLDHIGTTSRANVLVYLDGGHVFVGSHQGDSQVIRITEGQFEVVQTFANIAPIVDFEIMDLGSRSDDQKSHEFSSGQARIVTGSGAFGDGSLRSVRSGVGMEDLGVIAEMQHITDLFALSSSPSTTPFSDILVVSFFNETRIFKFSSDGEVEEVESFLGLNLSEPTLLAMNVADGRALQVTESTVKIADLESGMAVGEWTSPSGQLITSASANDEHVLIVVGGQSLLVLDITGDIKVVSQKEFGSENQISGVTIPSSPSEVCIVGFWQTAEISVFSLQTLEVLHKQILGQPGKAVPRSILLAQVLPGQPPTLFIAMADGHVVTYSFNSDYSLSGQSRTILGSEQAVFKVLPRGKDLVNVFAACEQPTLIYSTEDRMVYSAVNSDKASKVCHFNAEAYPGSTAIATPDELKIALVDTERTTQLQTLRVGETVRRIAYSAREKAFGLGTIKRSISKDGDEVVHSHFKLADEIAFRELDTYDLNEEELVESAIRAEFVTGIDEAGNNVYKDFFIVGTCFLEDGDDFTGVDAMRARILIFEVSPERKLHKVTEAKLKGACRTLAMMDGKVVAGLVKTVVVYNPIFGPFGSIKLEKSASYRCSTAPIDISVMPSTNGRTSTIAVADVMKSLSILTYTSGEKGESASLTEVARHYATAYATAVATVGPNTWLEADAEGNLMLLSRNESGVTVDDRRRLTVTAEFNLGEIVNRIRRIEYNSTTSTNPENPTTSPSISTSQPLHPTAFLGTVDGSIYLLALIPSPHHTNLLLRLQSATAARIQTPGGLPWAKHRAYRSLVDDKADEPFRVVDAELLEWWVRAEKGVQEEIWEEVRGGLGIGLGLEKEKGKGKGKGRAEEVDEDEEEGEEDGDEEENRAQTFEGGENWTLESVKALVEGFRKLC